MDLIATTSSTSPTWRRSVRRRAPEGELDVEGHLWRRVEELEEAVEELRWGKEAAEAEEASLRAELDAGRGAAETAASETMLMIERLQREKAAALMEARQFRRLAEGRADRDRELQDELASISALAGTYLSLFHAHGINPDDDGENHEQEEERPVEHISSESGVDARGTVVEESKSQPSAEEFECRIDAGCSVWTKAVEEAGVIGAAGDLYARVEALEADRSAMRREVAALRGERAQVVLAREVARWLCREAVTADRGIATTAQKPRFSALAVCKWLFSMILRRKKSSTSKYTSNLPPTLLVLLLLRERSTTLHHRQRLPRPQTPSSHPEELLTLHPAFTGL